MIPILHINDDEKAKAAKLVAFAKRPENWFWPGRDKWTPGDREEYVLTLDCYRCVFTISGNEKTNDLYRHFSISARRHTGTPHPLMIYTTATWFGFTGATMERGVAVKHPKNWIIHLSRDPYFHVVVAQKLTDKEVADLKEAANTSDAP